MSIGDFARVAVLGASGFIGDAVVRDLRRQDIDVQAISAPRLLLAQAQPGVILGALADSHRAVVDHLARQIDGCDAVVNAAGLSDATTSRDKPALFGANSLLPVLVQKARLRTGASRFVHISSAGVQGRAAVLSETGERAPISPYTRSKSLGEELLTAEWVGGTVLYRPTSVHGVGRSVSVTLARLARSRWSSVAGEGDRPTPQILVQNVGAAVTHVLRSPTEPPPVVLHPWEGQTTGSVLQVLSGGRVPKRIPEAVARGALGGLFAAGGRSARASAWARRLEMLWLGQEQEAGWLGRDGWFPPAGDAEWTSVGEWARRA